jgi:hypothetical protein
MLKTIKIIWVFIVLSMLINAINGCTIGMIGSMATHESGFCTIKVPEVGAKENILTIAEETGKELGYKIYGKTDNGITLQYGTPMLASMALGSTRMYNITVTKGIKMQIPANLPIDKKLAEMQKELTITVVSVGDYGAGGAQHAEKLGNEFKEKLLQRINQTPR